ncbi:MAG: insulinase family protein, partial [Planctomycetes bacterium]|nr:insulinase family protein [Planctomycetota bacterium]
MQFREIVLENGLEIVAECNPEAYSTAVGFFVKAGARDEAPEVSGVSHFLEHMVFKGTPHRSPADVNRELDEMGADSNAMTGEEQTIYHATVIPEMQDRAVELLADILRPSLRSEDFEMEKQVILEEIKMYEDEPPYGAYEKCMAAHFGDHPLGQSILGTMQSVGALTPEAMRGYFDQRYSPQNIVLAASGRVDWDRLVDGARRHCGSWDRRDVTRELSRPKGNTGLTTHRKDDAMQLYAVQISAGPAAEDDDRYAGRVMATVLGDDSGSRFYWELIDNGRADTAALSSFEYQGAGVFITMLCCAPEDAAANLERIAELEAEIQRRGISQSELEQAQSKICSSIVLASERPKRRMFSLGANWIQRREYRTVKDIIDAYQRVTRDDVATLLQKYPLT